MKKILSIIIPHFNSVQLLIKLLDSIPSKEDIEIIVIDDKSTEDKEIFVTLSQRKEYADIIFLYNTTNKKGAGTCRNLGIKYATGTWLLFADADDYFKKNFYEIVNRYFTSSNDIIFFTPTSIYIDTGEVADRHKRFCERLKNYEQYKSVKNELELRYKIDGPISKMINREFIMKYDILFEEVIVSNDTLFSSRVGFHMKTFEISNHVIYIITRNFNSLTVNTRSDIYEIRFKEKVKYYYFLKNRLSKTELNTLNIAFLDYLFRSVKYGFYTFLMVAKNIVKYNLPILDKRVFSFQSLFGLYKVALSIRKDKKYSGSL